MAFVVLIVTFGGTSLYSVINMSKLARQIRLIRTAYVPLALKAKELHEKQDNLRKFLDDIPGEAAVSRVEARIRSYRATRARYLREAIEISDALTDVPPGHERAVAEIRRHLSDFQQAIGGQDALYGALLADPPIDVVEPIDPQTRASATFSCRSLPSSRPRNRYGEGHYIPCRFRTRRLDRF